jgi:CheY-like chemotaxis protein
MIQLSKAGYHVENAGNGKRGLELGTTQAYDLILLNVELPDMTGFEICRELRSKTIAQNTPIVFVSGSELEAHRVEALKLGANEFIKKPFDLTDFLARVEHYVNKKQPTPVSGHPSLLVLNNRDPVWKSDKACLQKIAGIPLEIRAHSSDTPLVLNGEYSLIIVDGCEIASTICHIQRLQPETPVIFASSLPENLTEFLERHGLKVFATLRKPFCIQDFSEVVHRALNSRSQGQE